MLCADKVHVVGATLLGRVVAGMAESRLFANYKHLFPLGKCCCKDVIITSVCKFEAFAEHGCLLVEITHCDIGFPQGAYLFYLLFAEPQQPSFHI